MYVTPLQMVTYYDSRRILQLLTDDETDAVAGDLTDTGSDAYLLLVPLIRSVEAEIDGALQVGGRYSRSDMEGYITAAAAGGATEAEKKRAALLQRLAADLVFGSLVTRRGFVAAEVKDHCPRYEAAQQMLADLGDGKLIFDSDAHIAAGKPVPQRIGTQIDNTIRESRLFGIFGRDYGGMFYNG